VDNFKKIAIAPQSDREKKNNCLKKRLPLWIVEWT